MFGHCLSLALHTKHVQTNLLALMVKTKEFETIAKLRRVFRLALVWAEEAGHLKTAPLPSK